MSPNERSGPSTRAAQTEPAPTTGWRVLLRAERHRLRLTQAELAKRADLAPETLRKYESGGRSPTRASIERLLTALQVSQTTVREVLGELGFAAAATLRTAVSDPDYHFTVPQLRAFVEETPWPQFAVNNLMEIVAANAAAQTLWGIDLPAEFERRSRAELNFLAMAAERRFSERIGNWTELMGLIVGVLKAIPQSLSMLDEPGSLFGEVFATFAENDPTAIPKLFALWERTSRATAKVRWNYPVIWRDPGVGEIRFLGTVTVANEPEAIGFNDWIPADAVSHALFEKVLAAPTRGGREPGGRGTKLSPRRATGR